MPVLSHLGGHAHFKLAAGEDDAFLALLDPSSGGVLGGWQLGSESRERVYALGVDDNTGDVVVGGYSNGSLFADNGEAWQCTYFRVVYFTQCFQAFRGLSFGLRNVQHRHEDTPE